MGPSEQDTVGEEKVAKTHGGSAQCHTPTATVTFTNDTCCVSHEADGEVTTPCSDPYV